MLEELRKEIEKMTDEELIEAYKKSAEHVNNVWRGSHDGSYECAWCMEVEPYEDELNRRGIKV